MKLHPSARAALTAIVVSVFLTGCGGHGRVKSAVSPDRAAPASTDARSICGHGGALRVHFYDVGQGLAVLVDLPDGQHILVDSADRSVRTGCDRICGEAHDRLLRNLKVDLHGQPIDLFWITHQHSDHIGGASAVLSQFNVKLYADNGRDLTRGDVQVAHAAARKAGTPMLTVDPSHPKRRLFASDLVSVTGISPYPWPTKCKSNPNDCSILLRIDYCSSSVLFTGDAEEDEERLVDSGGPVTLLQVGHHGSSTSSSEAFIAKLNPKYAVISAGKPHEGLNKGYCHPRASVVARLTTHLGGAGKSTLRAFTSNKCHDTDPTLWKDVPASDQLWATERDGNVVLETNGDGTFHRVF